MIRIPKITEVFPFNHYKWPRTYNLDFSDSTVWKYGMDSDYTLDVGFSHDVLFALYAQQT